MISLYKIFEFDVDDITGAAAKAFKKSTAAISNASEDNKFFKPKATERETKWYKPWQSKVSSEEKSRIRGLTRGRSEGFNKGITSNDGYKYGFSKGTAAGETSGYKKGTAAGETLGYKKGTAAGETLGYKKGSTATMNRVNTDDKLRGQITRDHISKKAGEAVTSATNFATKNAKTIGLVGAGAAGAAVLAKRRRQ